MKFIEDLIMATATTTKAAPKKAPAKKVTAKKAPAKKVAAKKVAAKKSNVSSFRATADKAVNVYFGVIGQGIDRVKENMESARKENDKRVKQLEKRGAKLRTELNGRFDKIEMPELDNVVEDVKAQISKVQDQVEDVVGSVKGKLKAA
ncbi:MAG: hypothetical protein ACI9GB_002334 [Halioglobus sp.]